MASSTTQASSLIEQARLARQQGNREAALARFRAALALQPAHASLPAEIATELRALNRCEEAAAVLAELQARLPDSVHVPIGLAHIARQQGDRETALAQFRAALALQQTHANLPAEIATELRALNRFEEAAAVLTELQARLPDSVHVPIGLAHIARQQGDRETALVQFRAALALQPTHASLPAEIATELRELGRFDEARDQLIAALPRHPNPGLLWQHLGQIALFEDDTDEALRCFEEGIAVQPNHLSCYSALIGECLRLGWLERAESALAQGLAQVPMPRALQRLEVRLLKVRGELEAAYERAFDLWLAARDDIDNGLVLIQYARELGRFDTVELVLERLESTANARRLQLTQQRAHLAMARYALDEAERYWQAALALATTPDQAAGIQHQLARVYLMRGDTQTSGEYLRAFESVRSRHASARLRAGAKGGLYYQFWREFRTNPFAERALREAMALPPEARSAALAQVLEDEPDHIGTAMAWLVEGRQRGLWARHTPKQSGIFWKRIPRQIIQFWDTTEIPDDIREIMASWPRACLGYRYQVFDEAAALAFLAGHNDARVQRAFRQAGHAAMRADLFRLAYLAVAGGIYVDADDYARRSLERWLAPGYDLVLLQEDIGSIGNNFMAAAPKHPFIEAALAALAAVVDNILNGQGDTVWFISGPGALSRVFCQLYRETLRAEVPPAGVRLFTKYELQQTLTMHLPRAYKQDARGWSSPKAQARPLFMTEVRRRSASTVGAHLKSKIPRHPGDCENV